MVSLRKSRSLFVQASLEEETRISMETTRKVGISFERLEKVLFSTFSAVTTPQELGVAEEGFRIHGTGSHCLEKVLIGLVDFGIV